MSTLTLELIALLCTYKMLLHKLDSFRAERIPREIKTFVGNKNIKTNIFRILEYDSIMCGYLCIEFIDFMFARKTLTEFTNLFSPNNFKKNDDIILKCFIINV